MWVSVIRPSHHLKHSAACHIRSLGLQALAKEEAEEGWCIVQRHLLVVEREAEQDAPENVAVVHDSDNGE